MDSDDLKMAVSWVVFIVVCVGVLMGAHAGYCGYSVWISKKHGQAELAQAESNRQIKTLEAKASMDSARFLADAEVIRAEGVAKANAIIGGSLKGNDAYLRYLWINSLQHGNETVVYVPTEANLPILEAKRLGNG